MRLIVNEFISLDGVVQAPGGADEDTDGGFRHGGWSMQFFDPEAMGPAINEVAEGTDALLQGRRTWQVMAAAWPERAGDEFADWMNRIPKYVVSNTLSESDLSWKPTTIIRGGDLVESIAALRAQSGGYLSVMGSATLVQALLSADLVDEVALMIEPVTLGGGKTIFPDDGTARTFRLTHAATAKTGAQICRYERAR